MGVSCCGKSTVGEKICQLVHDATFLDGDSFHSAENIAKMRRGEGLDDTDRRPWLEAIADVIARAEANKAGGLTVLACSALKQRYRALLVSRCKDPKNSVYFVHLQLSRNEALARSESRLDHFARPSLIQSQFEALELFSDVESDYMIPMLVEVHGKSVSDIAQEVLRHVEV